MGGGGPLSWAHWVSRSLPAQHREEGVPNLERANGMGAPQRLDVLGKIKKDQKSSVAAESHL